jgi:aerobic-type carbon monoxide dehydrogenase small subunit (CoxS/CutS family)
MPTLKFVVNDRDSSCDVHPDKPLLWVLRENLQLTGTKYGCGIAMCGACTVLIETRSPGGSLQVMPVRSCVLRAEDAQGKHFRTIEGLSDADGRAVQQAWIAEDVPQCGYCQSGQIMTTVALLTALRREGRELRDDDIDAALAGNLCRCGTYPRIRRAVKTAAVSLNIPVRG